MRILFKIKIMLILIGIIILSVSATKPNEKWEVVKVFKTLKNIEEKNNLSSVQIGFLNDKVGFAIYRGNHVYYSSDSGNSWAETVVDTRPCITGMELFDEKNIIVGCQCSNLEYSSDNGKTWNKGEEKNYSHFSFYNNNSGILFQTSSISNIKKVDNFKSVGEIELPEDYYKSYIADVSSINTNEAYILMAGKGPLIRTRDGGKSWEKIRVDKIKDNLNFLSDVSSMRFTDMNNGTIVTYYSKIQKWISLTTNDGGKSWKYTEILKTGKGWQSYLSRDGNFVTINNGIDEEYPVVLLKRKI